jgi:hypothetical protein
MNASPEYATTTGADYVRVANPYGTTFIAHPNGLTISDWTASGASKFPTTYTHIRFGVKGGSNPRITLQVTKPFALTDTKIYGFFVDDKNNYSTGFPPWTWGVALSPIAYYQFADTTVEFGNYS